jgi:hypothetical protein
MPLAEFIFHAACDDLRYEYTLLFSVVVYSVETLELHCTFTNTRSHVLYGGCKKCTVRCRNIVYGKVLCTVAHRACDMFHNRCHCSLYYVHMCILCTSRLFPAQYSGLSSTALGNAVLTSANCLDYPTVVVLTPFQ